jgi:hypothetical protein
MHNLFGYVVKEGKVFPLKEKVLGVLTQVFVIMKTCAALTI